MTVENLNPDAEFNEDPTGVDDGKAAAAAAEAALAKDRQTKDEARDAKLADLEAGRADDAKKIAALTQNTRVMQQIKEIFTGKELDPKDAFITSEIRKRIPELADLAEMKKYLPAIMEALKEETDDRLSEKVETANDVLRDLMGDMGLDPKDAKAVAYLEESVSREIRDNDELLKAWKRGNVKSAVKKAFDEVQSKLFAPMRGKAKRSAVNTIIESPKSSSRSNVLSKGGEGSGKKSYDPKDTSRDGIKKVHEAAADMLEELMDR